MHLYLIRHAHAVDLGDPEGGAPASDAERPLSAKGRRRFPEVVALLDRMGVRLDQVRTSPLLRTRETAELLRPILDGEIVVEEALARPPSDALLARVRGRSVALVGHEPWTSQLLALLLFGEPRAGAPLSFSKGAVACLEGEPRVAAMRLRFLLPGRVGRE